MAYWGSFGKGLAPALEQITRYQLMKPMLERETEMRRQEREDEYRRRQKETAEERKYNEAQKEKELRRTTLAAREGFKGGLEPSEYEEYLREQQTPGGEQGPVMEPDYGGMPFEEALSESARLGGYAGRKSEEREYARDIGKTLIKEGIPNTQEERIMDAYMRKQGKTYKDATYEDYRKVKKELAESGHAINLSGISGMYNQFAQDLDSQAMAAIEGDIPLPDPSLRLTLPDRVLIGRANKLLKDSGANYSITDLTMDYTATKKAIQSANSAPWARQRAAIETIQGQWHILDDAISDWNPGKVKMFNKAAVWAAAQAGDPKAQQLVTALGVLVPELAQAFKGSASPTDIGLQEAGKLLSSDFSGNQFKSAIEIIKRDLDIREKTLNRLYVTGGKGIYYQEPQNTQSSETPPQEGDTKLLDDGRTAIFKNGRWIAPKLK